MTGPSLSSMLFSSFRVLFVPLKSSEVTQPEEILQPRVRLRHPGATRMAWDAHPRGPCAGRSTDNVELLEVDLTEDGATADRIVHLQADDLGPRAPVVDGEAGEERLAVIEAHPRRTAGVVGRGACEGFATARVAAGVVCEVVLRVGVPKLAADVEAGGEIPPVPGEEEESNTASSMSPQHLTHIVDAQHTAHSTLTHTAHNTHSTQQHA